MPTVSVNDITMYYEIHVPTLILHGKKDKTAPYHLAEAMQSGIKGSQMITFPGGHLFFIVRQKQFIEAIADFWASLAWPHPILPF